MSKNVAKKIERPLSDKTNEDRSRNSYPPEQTESEKQQGRFKQSAPGAAEALKPPPARAVRVEFSASAANAAKPPPQSARPNSLSSPPETNRSPMQTPQKTPSTAPTPKPTAVATTPSLKNVQPIPPAPSAKPAAPPQPQTANAPRTISVNFVLPGPNAKQVWLCGDFNAWSRNNNPMKRRNDGQWETTLALRPGRYQYKFLVDGEWIVDPAAKQNAANAFGTLNSVLEVLS
jgi:hypothetical protein